MTARRGTTSPTPELRVHGVAIWRSNPRFRPPTDVYERADTLCVRVEVGGMRREDFRIVLDAERFTIQGRRERQEERGAAYHQVEVGYGDFEVVVRVPFAIRSEAVRAAYEEGMLIVELPRRREDERTVIQVPIEARGNKSHIAESEEA